MEKIIRRNGFVYQVIEHDAYGRHATITNLGKDPDDPMWKEEVKEMKKKWKKKKEEDD